MDVQLGRYGGTLEIRPGDDGRLQLIRVVSVADVVHADGRAVDLIWTGSVQSATPDAATLSVALRRADFIPRVAAPLEVIGDLSVGDGRALAIGYTAAVDPGFAITETGVFTGAPGTEPIFRSDRRLRETHPPPDPILRALLFELFESFHDLPAVAPFTDDLRFRRAVHFQVIERTDFDFYRAKPNRIWVVDKVVDAISLAETEIRANAFRAALGAKAAFYQDGLTNEFVGPTGMVLRDRSVRGVPLDDQSNALWTGVYTWTQALMSPFPASPWRRDWDTNSDRQQSITAFPLLEQMIDRYRWNAQHFEIAVAGLGGRRVPGVDYLFPYWIARDGGLISPDA